MSMRDYAIEDYGLVLDEETTRLIASKVFESFVDDDEEYGYGDWGYELYDKGICEYISEFTGEAQIVYDDGSICFGNDDYDYIYNCNDIVYVPLAKYSTLFKKAYNNMDEIVEEFKSKLGKYLHEDFDYRSRIRHICGTYYG